MRAPATALPTPIPAAAPGAIDFECLDTGVVVKLDEFVVRDEFFILDEILLLDDFVVLDGIVVPDVAGRDETPWDVFVKETISVLSELVVELIELSSDVGVEVAVVDNVVGKISV